MPTQSAGILFYRYQDNELYLLLVHPGGPFWAKKDEGAWTIPKGEIAEGASPLDAAKREVKEETGIALHNEPLLKLTTVKQKAGKVIYAWACEKEIAAEQITSNTFEIEWPPKSGKHKSFAEIDKAAWFTIEEAKLKINTGQVPMIDELYKKLCTKKS